MKNIIYGLIQEQYILGDETRISYGVAAYADPEFDGTVTVVASAHDLSGDKNVMTDFVNKCNELQLSLLHFDDVIEDFLCR